MTVTHLKRLLGAVSAANAWIITHGLQSDTAKILSKSHTQYRVNNAISKRDPLSTNTNHIHYILFDNGIRNSFSGSGVAQFQMNFESLLSASPKRYSDLEIAAQRLQHGVPIVVCGSMGGIADVLEKTFQFRKSDKK
ncbi:hypothetical protein ACTXT7_010424 [Hymenolepis weldensis]